MCYLSLLGKMLHFNQDFFEEINCVFDKELSGTPPGGFQKKENLLLVLTKSFILSTTEWADEKTGASKARDQNLMRIKRAKSKN